MFVYRRFEKSNNIILKEWKKWFCAKQWTIIFMQITCFVLHNLSLNSYELFKLYHFEWIFEINVYFTGDIIKLFFTPSSYVSINFFGQHHDSPSSITTTTVHSNQHHPSPTTNTTFYYHYSPTQPFKSTFYHHIQEK